MFSNMTGTTTVTGARGENGTVNLDVTYTGKLNSHVIQVGEKSHGFRNMLTLMYFFKHCFESVSF